MAWEEGWRNIEAQIEKFHPLHDFCLVRHEPEPEVVLKSGLHMTKDFRWREDRPRGVRRGRVIAIGRGDRKFLMWCERCAYLDAVHCLNRARQFRVNGEQGRPCHHCGNALAYATSNGEPIIKRCEMDVCVGDLVLYPRIPANDVIINGVEYTLCHEQQHVLAVLEPDEVGGEVSSFQGKTGGTYGSK